VYGIRLRERCIMCSLRRDVSPKLAKASEGGQRAAGSGYDSVALPLPTSD